MIREVNYKGKIIKYTLERKKVKNINLRVKPDLTVYVSANRRVSQKYIDEFVSSKGDFILKAIESFNKKIEFKAPEFTADEFIKYAVNEFERVYSLYNIYNIKKPELKFRKMKSRWGSCNYVKGVITLSTNLIYCTKEQITYVIIHEYAHLLVHNHSKDFYNIVEKFSPDYKKIRKEMNKINLR